MLICNGSVISPTMFSDKTSQVWKLPKSFREDGFEYNITWEFESEAELFHLRQLTDLLRYGFMRDHGNEIEMNLYMPYLPYGRQDKIVGNNRTFALFSFANILQEMKFNTITTLDAHSDYLKEKLIGYESIYPKREINSAIVLSGADYIGYPDAGAVKRYKIEMPSVTGEKIRDQETGWIKSYKLLGNEVLTGKSILIVDDICDGGMTFKLFARDLYAAGAKEVYLYVTHGIFSADNGVNFIFESGIKRVFTRDGEVV